MNNSLSVQPWCPDAPRKTNRNNSSLNNLPITPIKTNVQSQPSSHHVPPNNRNRSPRTPSKPVKSPPNNDRSSSYNNNCFESSSASSSINPAELPSSMQSLSHPPPLMNLTTNNNKIIHNKTWSDIEAQNLESILESNKTKELFLCDTSIIDIYHSFRDDRLEISQRNMENIASSGNFYLNISRFKFSYFLSLNFYFSLLRWFSLQTLLHITHPHARIGTFYRGRDQREPISGSDAKPSTQRSIFG